MEKIICKLLLISFCCSVSYLALSQKKNKINNKNKIEYKLPPKVDSSIDSWISKHLRNDDESSFGFMIYLRKCTFDDSLGNTINGYHIYVFYDYHKLNNGSLSCADIIYFRSKRVIVTNSNKYIVPVFIEDFDDVFSNQEYIYDPSLNSWFVTEFRTLKHGGLSIYFDLFNVIYSNISMTLN